MFRLLTNRKRPLSIEWFFFVKKLLTCYFFCIFEGKIRQ